MSKTLSFPALVATQGKRHRVLMIRANAAEINQIARIDRLGRSGQGKLRGFQRPQIAAHIADIRDYLKLPSAILPNALVIAFVKCAAVKVHKNGATELSITVDQDPPGYVVDGQQRLTALTAIGRSDFQVFVACIICDDLNELRQQFILINNTRPLPKSLIYELLPTVTDLPERMASRTLAAKLTERLNFDTRSSLHGLIHLHTNPVGPIKETAIQKVIMNSASNGALRELLMSERDEDVGFSLLSNFYGAVQDVFPEAWIGHTPKTSRLVHGAGIQAMGYVMEFIVSQKGRFKRSDFAKGLAPLRRHVAWTSGAWRFGRDDIVPWNRLENVPRQILTLAHYLVARTKSGAAPAPGGRRG